MKRKILLALGLVLALTLCVSAALAENQAKIGTTEYETIDAAIEAANVGDTIVLLEDVKATKTFYKSLTFTGGHKLSMDCYGWRYNGDLVFDGADFAINSDSTSPVANNGEAGKWFTMVLSGSITAKNSAHVTFSFDSDCGTNCAIYAGTGGKGVTIKVENGSSFSIYGKNTAGVAGQGIQLDSTANTGIFVTGGSRFMIDGTNRGYVNSPEIYVENSTFTVQNCTSNASNGGKYTAINAKINYLNNRGHGLSVGMLTIDNSTVTASGNGANGIHATGELKISNGATVTVEDNDCSISSKWTIPGAFYMGGASSKIENSTVTIRNNRGSGIYQKSDSGKLTIADDANVTVVCNTAEKLGYGGGIYVNGEANLGKKVTLYNNHAGTAGDDIYVNAGVITFGPTGSGWKLDGGPDCYGAIHAIDGWYEDGENNKGLRWNADAEDAADRYIHWYDCGTYQGTLALKAAHDVIPEPVVPEEPEVPVEPVTPPQTGDNSTPLAWLCALLACAACLTVLRFSRKRRA